MARRRDLYPQPPHNLGTRRRSTHCRRDMPFVLPPNHLDSAKLQISLSVVRGLLLGNDPAGDFYACAATATEKKESG